MINFIHNNLDKTKLYKISFSQKLSWKPTTWLGALIRVFANIEFNHTGILYYLNDKWMIQEAIDKSGVKSDIFINSNAYHYYNNYRLEEPDFDYDYDECMKRLFSIEGKLYDYKGLLFYQLWLNIFNKWIGRAKTDGKRYYCYESVAYIFGITEKKPKNINSKFNIAMFRNPLYTNKNI